MIVKVKDKYIDEWRHQEKYYVVYNIRDDRAGYPHFLIYHRGQWIYKSAKYFEIDNNRKEETLLTLNGKPICKITPIEQIGS